MDTMILFWEILNQELMTSTHLTPVWNVALVPKKSFFNQMNIMISKRDKSLVVSLAQLSLLLV